MTVAGLQHIPLRVLIYSHFFYPSIGGSEAVGLVLASELGKLGCRVQVFTPSLGANDPGWKFDLLRSASFTSLLRASSRAEVLLHNPLSLRAMLASILTWRPSVVGIHIWLDHLRHPSHPVVQLRRLALRLSKVVVCPSKAVANSVGPDAVVLPNPIDTSEFVMARKTSNHRSGIVCAGRLVSDKGFDVAIRAVARLKNAGSPMRLLILGDGPERLSLKKLAIAAGVNDLVIFGGEVSRNQLARAMASARFCLVPSRWAEPFGIVAVEALAAGCITVVSETGGLPEATGSLGFTVPPGDAESLANCVGRLRDAAPPSEEGVTAHLEQFKPARVATRWVEILREARV